VLSGKTSTEGVSALVAFQVEDTVVIKVSISADWAFVTYMKFVWGFPQHHLILIFFFKYVNERKVLRLCLFKVHHVVRCIKSRMVTY
jgi:hypothetical protein